MDHETYLGIKADIDRAASHNVVSELEHLGGHCLVQTAIARDDITRGKWKVLTERVCSHARRIDEENRALLDRFKQQVDLDYLETHPRECHTLRCCNSVGCLWEKLYKYEDGKFQSKTCASGVYVNWDVHEDREHAEWSLLSSIRTILKIRDEEREIREREQRLTT